MPCGCLFAVIASLPLTAAAPATLTFEQHNWRNESWGVHAVHGHRQSGLVAISGNGSRLNRLQASSYKFHWLPGPGARVELLYLASEDAYYTRWPDTGEVERSACHCTWDRVRPDPTADCVGVARHWYGPGVERAGAGRVAGQRVVRWRAGDEEEIAMAPERGCEVMEKITTSYGRFGIPAARYYFVVTSYKPGEPDPALFRVPRQ